MAATSIGARGGECEEIGSVAYRPRGLKVVKSRYRGGTYFLFICSDIFAVGCVV